MLRAGWVLVAALCACVHGRDPELDREAAQIEWEPFLWGAATAAYQVEGAASLDYRGPSIWDSFAAKPGKVYGGDTGDVAADSYHLFRKDIELMKELGLNSYRFSISWSRLFPNGTAPANPLGFRYYDALVDTLIAADIQPVVTLYHWDLPDALEKSFGGLRGGRFADHFVAYARACFEHFNDRVKKWITFNEPWSISYGGYGSGVFAPGRCSDRAKCPKGDSAVEPYLVAHHILEAHSRVAELYAREFKNKKYPVRAEDPAGLRGVSALQSRVWRSARGMLGMTLNLDWSAPYQQDREDHQLAANLHREFQLAWFLDPLVLGAYPQSMCERVGARLPTISNELRTRLLSFPLDFLGLNHYSTKFYFPHSLAGVKNGSAALENVPEQAAAQVWGGWLADRGVYESKVDPMGLPIGPQAASTWLNTVPWGFYNAIMFVHTRYAVALASGGSGGELMIYITENGCDAPGEDVAPLPQVLEDTFRVTYLQDYLEAMDRAVKDGASVKGYFVWSLLDNFEWADGYSKRFGIHYVDFSDKHRARYPKRSALWYKNYVAHHRKAYLGRAVLIPPMVGPPVRVPPVVDPPAALEPPSALDPPRGGDLETTLLPCLQAGSCGWRDFLSAALRVGAEEAVLASIDD